MASTATLGRRRTGKFRVVHAGGQRQIAVGEAAAARQQHVALAEVDAGGADMPAHAGASVMVMRRRRPRIFLDHDGVGAIGDHAAGKDPNRLAAADRPVEWPSGRDLADHLESAPACGGVGRPHRVTVHRRHRLRRLGAQRREVARQHTAMAGIERDHFLGQRLGARENSG